MRRIRADKKIGYACVTVAVAASFLVLFVPKEILLWICAAMAIAVALGSAAVIKKRSILSYTKGQVALILSVAAALYVMLYYLSGLYFGFASSPGGVVSARSIFGSVLPLLLAIAASEQARVVLLSAESRVCSLGAYLFGVACVIACSGGVGAFTSAYRFANFVGMTLFPALTANLLFHYTAKRYGAMPAILYRILISAFFYFIPIAPNVPNALPSFVTLVLPIVLQLFIDALFEKKKRRALQKKSRLGLPLGIAASVLMVGFLLLITCQFRFGLLVIATESMSGEIERGDAVIFEQYRYCDQIEENDVIVFEENGRQVVHRVVEIQTVNGQRQYITQGDANDGPDAGFRTDSHVIGLVRGKVLYVGFPTLWLHQTFN